MSTVSYDTFIKNHLNKAVDYDGAAGVQCMDLVKCYLKEVFGISPGAWGRTFRAERSSIFPVFRLVFGS